MKHVLLCGYIILTHVASFPFWFYLFIPCFKLNVSMNYDLFTVSCLLISFIIFTIIFICGSIFYLLSCLWDHVVYKIFLCTDFVCCILKYDYWFFFGLFVYLLHIITLYVYLYLHCRLQYLYWVTLFLWYYQIGRFWLCINYFIHSYNLSPFLVFFTLLIYLLVDWIVIITYYSFLQIL